MLSLRLSCFVALSLGVLAGCSTVSRQASLPEFVPTFSIAQIHVAHPLSNQYQITLKAGDHAIEVTPKFQPGRPIHLVVHLESDHVYNVEFMQLYLTQPLSPYEPAALVLDSPPANSTVNPGPSLFAASLRDEDTGIPAKLFSGPSSVVLTVNTHNGLRHVYATPTSTPDRPMVQTYHLSQAKTQSGSFNAQPDGVGFTLNAEGMGCWNCSWVIPNRL
jgi:hypothetical protein